MHTLQSAILAVKADLDRARTNVEMLASKASRSCSSDDTQVDSDLAHARMDAARHASLLWWLRIVQQEGCALLQDCTDHYDERLQELADENLISIEMVKDKHRLRPMRV